MFAEGFCEAMIRFDDPYSTISVISIILDDILNYFIVSLWMKTGAVMRLVRLKDSLELYITQYYDYNIFCTVVIGALQYSICRQHSIW